MALPSRPYLCNESADSFTTCYDVVNGVKSAISEGVFLWLSVSMDTAMRLS